MLVAVAGLREIPRLARASTWLEVSTRSLFGARVTIVGGGGIAGVLLSLLAPFRARITVVRRHPQPMAGVAEVVAPDALLSALAGADVVFLAPALTLETAGMIGEPELRAMGPGAWLVNVGQGGLVLTDALLRALREGWIAGAALDVTDPEPLPDGHAYAPASMFFASGVNVLRHPVLPGPLPAGRPADSVPIRTQPAVRTLSSPAGGRSSR